MISSVRNAEVSSPPTIGAAMRFITSAPVPWLHSSGTSPNSMLATVISLARTRSSVPSLGQDPRSLCERVSNDRLRLLYIAAEVPRAGVHIDEDVADEESGLVAQHRRSLDHLHLCELPERQEGQSRLHARTASRRSTH